MTAAYGRTNAEIEIQLYKAANQADKISKIMGNDLRDKTAIFIIEANMLNFSENNAVWKKLPSGLLYDSRSVKHIYLRHIGVYKSPDGNIMGIFDVNCEDINDVQERTYGYVTKTEVYFSPKYKNLYRGRSYGLVKTFCKN